MSRCIWAAGEHFWSIPQPDGTQTCLWCREKQQANPPIDSSQEASDG